MRPFLAYFVLGLAFCASANAEQARELVREFQVGKQPQVRLDLPSAAIEVITGEPGIVRMRTRMTLATGDVAKAEKAFDGMNFEYAQSSGRVRLEAHRRKSVLWDWDPQLSVQVVIELTVPLACDISVELGSGSVSLEALDGSLSMQTGAGSVVCQTNRWRRAGAW